MAKAGRLSPEAKVGLFVLLGLMVLVFMSLRVSEFRFVKATGYPLVVYFRSAEGLKKESGVQIAGVQVGRVREISLDQNRARVVIQVRRDLKLKRDSKAVMKTRGVLGEKYIELVPGTPTAEFMEPQDVIFNSVSAPDVDQLLTYLGSIAEDFQEVSASLRKALGGPEREKILTKTLDNIKESTDDLKSLIRDSDYQVRNIISNFDRFSSDLRFLTGETQKIVGGINRIVMKVDRGEGSLGRFIGDDALYEEATGTIREVKKAFSEVRVTLKQIRGAMKDASGAVASLNRMAQKIERGEGSLGKLVADDELYQEVRKGVKDIREILAGAKKAIGSLQRVAMKLEQGEGTLGKLITDESLYSQAKKTLRSVDRAAEGLQDQIPITVLGVVAGTVLQ